MLDIYLDHNVHTDLIFDRRPGIYDDLQTYKQGKSRFPYSPAHLEEIAVLYRSASYEEAHPLVCHHIYALGVVSECVEYLPQHGNTGPGRIVLEHPQICFDRVVDDYGLTFAAEANLRFVMCSKNAESYSSFLRECDITTLSPSNAHLFEIRRAKFGIIPKEINNIDPDNLFMLESVRNAFNERLWHHGFCVDSLPKFDSFANSFPSRRLSIDLTMNCLEMIGYWANEYDQCRSLMHDTSHAIYGSMADMFVSGDKRLVKRIQAAYSFLQVPTHVFNTQEFQEGAAELRQIGATVREILHERGELPS